MSRFILIALSFFISLSVWAQKQEFYQLKIYSFDSEEQATTTDKYLREAYLPALKKLKLGNIGVFKTRLTDIDTVRKTYILIPFKSLDQFEKLEANLVKNEVYLQTGKEYLTANYTSPPYSRVQSILLRAFADMPNMKPSPLIGNRADRIYELRSYESPTEAYFSNKVKMFNAGGEVKLFNDLEFNAVFYGEVVSGGAMPNLMYMTTFSDQQSRDQHWKSFVDSPVWKGLKADKQYQNNVSHIDISFLYPTEYSDY